MTNAQPSPLPAISRKDEKINHCPFPDLPSDKQVAQEDRIRADFFRFMAGEIAAVELCAASIYQFDSLPWDLYQDLSEQLADEIRHVVINWQQVDNEGGFKNLPPSTNLYYDVYNRLSLVGRLCRLCLTDEINALTGQSNRMLAWQAMGRRDLAVVTERVMHDEIAHVALGRKWVGYYAEAVDLSLTDMVELADQELEQCLASLTPEDWRDPTRPSPPMRIYPFDNIAEAHERLKHRTRRAAVSATAPPLSRNLLGASGFSPDQIEALALQLGRNLTETPTYINDG